MVVAAVMFATLPLLRSNTSMSLALRPVANADCAALTLSGASGLTQTPMPELMLTLISFPSAQDGSTCKELPSASKFHSAFLSTPWMVHKSATGSEPAATDNAYCCFANGLSASNRVSCCSLVSTLGANLVSKTMISSRWDWLIQPSMPKIMTVKSVSKASDQISSFHPRFCLALSNFSFSQYTPTVTPIVEKTYAAAKSHFAISKPSRGFLNILGNIAISLAGLATLRRCYSLRCGLVNRD